MAPRSGDGVGEAIEATRSRRQRGTTARARKLRQGGNKAEALLWLELKNRELGGHRFTRQLPVGPYFADFTCREKWLVVEVDGSQHAGSAYDDARDKFIRTQGYSSLRFWNADVLNDRRSVCDTILAALEGRLAPHIESFDLRYHQARRPSRPAEQLTLNQRVQQRASSDSIPSTPDPTS